MDSTTSSSWMMGRDLSEPEGSGKIVHGHERVFKSAHVLTRPWVE